MCKKLLFFYIVLYIVRLLDSNVSNIKVIFTIMLTLEKRVLLAEQKNISIQSNIIIEGSSY
ncbi:hypothetical protein FDZ58_00305 [Ehrlichia ruminantium]|uniref:Uncharacterized protein n=1 Tax=Ehrlichia ruminantium (strain Welgevonden) TaxID=254945 RepID=A0A0H3LYX4_EHRRW|nr:hypothetical protein FDZ68_00305 [Ehrlichia ruminantium]CAI26536.1 Hypothetical protein ERWE_CDS_00420 [Ehrlichia ruminantium str. Welgevonden]QLK51055.1 hypothetical protein FDZ66_00305 [Ehrlichia ruminantium]QLK51977.1 hypothetical protein FDZ65_00295 [Ehrlichia ruminantium]QLK52887.1 hypothetical protein FDZ64_00295 [Ehrlichia ruminantium]